MKKILVEVEDDEVLVKYKINEDDMCDFLGRTIQLTNYVSNPPSDLDEKSKLQLDEAILEDSIHTTLMNEVHSTYEVLASPISVQQYRDGVYEEVFDTYMNNKVKEIVDGFFQ